MSLRGGSVAAGRNARPRLARAEAWWRAGSLLVSFLLFLPVAAIVYLAFTPSENVWPHLLATVLPGYLWNTAVLLAGVGALTFAIGTGTAWLVSTTDFPARSTLQWLLVLPLATPTYIIAYTYVEIFDYAGPVQTALREFFGWRTPADYWFPEIRSTGGAVFIMSAVLYPYVFMTARASFLRQSVSHLEVARTLGSSSWHAFFAVALPLARPAIAVGIGLAMLEALNDIGAVEYFGVRTLTLGIYSTWLSRNNLGGAAQIAVVMLVVVFALLWLEQHGRRRQSFHHIGRREPPVSPARLEGWRAWAATLACAAPVVLGFVIPVSVLVRFAARRLDAVSENYATAVANTLTVAATAAAAAVVISLFLAYAHRLARSRAVRLAVGLSSLGYAIPGTVLAIGILVPLAAADNAVSGFFERTFGHATGLLLIGSLLPVAYGYVVRFLAISYGTLDSGLGRVTPNLDAAARTLGLSPFRTLIEVHLPLVRPAVVSAALLVFVDCMKELPATLILRPFNFDTLATMVYTLASLDQLEESALAALTIVAAGVVPVIVLTRTLLAAPRRRPGSENEPIRS